MKKNLVLSIFILCSSVLIAQPKVVNTAEVVIVPFDNGLVMNPSWSPDGKLIAFTFEKHEGIWISDSNGDNIRELSSDKGAGFGYSWSHDSKKIVARTVSKIDGRRYHNIKVYDVNTMEEKVLFSERRDLKGLPQWSEDGSRVTIDTESGVKSVALRDDSLKSSILEEVEDFDFPEFEGRYIFNRRLSPDRSSTVFQVSGKGLYIANSDGSDLRYLGLGEQAAWMPCGDYIIVTIVDDDGKVITAADLYSVDVKTGDYSSLFEDESFLSLNPHVSADGAYLLFDNPQDGSIYRLELN
ncbi:hypothetical protein QA597_01755 [Marinilabiliaceae bacterium ANBcel2]|nr:hypothetical protein [Marinilabiliaceae bacterium ANBcel2]